MEIIKNPNFDFLGKAKYFVALSVLLIVAGMGWVAMGHLHYGVEFSGGTQLILSFQNPPEIDKIRDAVTGVSPGAVIQSYGEPGQHKVLVRVAGSDSGERPAAAASPSPAATAAVENAAAPTDAVAAPGAETPVPPVAAEPKPATAETADAEGEIDKTAEAVRGALAARYSANPVLESSTEIVGPVVSSELRDKAVLLTVLGLLFQLVYIAARFKGGVWGVGATLAAFHDVLICLGFLAFFRFELTLNVIAALLTLVGYSVNDTIVIFDRVRENLMRRRKDALDSILNDSLNQTLTRTIISNGTTFLAVLGLFLFGGEVLRGFGFVMVVGIIVGTYSTLFIAVPLVSWWYRRKGGIDEVSVPAKPQAKPAKSKATA